MFRISAKRSDVQDGRYAIEIKAPQSIAAERSVCEVFGLCFSLNTFIPWSELTCRGTHLSNIFTLIHSSFSYPFLLWLMYSTVFFPGGFYKALHSFPKHFSSLQLLIEWNKFCLANYLNRCEFILHISHRFSWIFLHSMNYSWSRIDGWPKQQHVIVNNMYWQPNTFPETTKSIFEGGVNPQITLCNSW